MWSRISDDGPAASLTSPQSSTESGSGPVRAARRRALRLGPPLTVVLYAAGTLAGTARPAAAGGGRLLPGAGRRAGADRPAGGQEPDHRHLRQRLRGGGRRLAGLRRAGRPVVLAARRDPAGGGRDPDPGVPAAPPPPGAGGRAGPAGRRGRRGRPGAAPVAGPAGPHRPPGRRVRRPRGDPGRRTWSHLRLPGSGRVTYSGSGPGHREAGSGGPAAARLAAVRARRPGPRGDPARGRAGRAGRDRAAARRAGLAEHHPARSRSACSRTARSARSPCARSPR